MKILWILPWSLLLSITSCFALLPYHPPFSSIPHDILTATEANSLTGTGRAPHNLNGALISNATSDYVQGLLREWGTPGLALAVVQKLPSTDSELPQWKVEFASYGLATTVGERKPVSPDTLFAIASNSKLFLSASIGLLVTNETLKEEFKRTRGVELGWTTRMRDLIPELWQLWDEDAERGATIQDLLSHRTGLPRHDLSSVRTRSVKEMVGFPG